MGEIPPLPSPRSETRSAAAIASGLLAMDPWRESMCLPMKVSRWDGVVSDFRLIINPADRNLCTILRNA